MILENTPLAEPLDFAAGQVLLIDKPLTWTSFDVVNKLRWALQIKKIGHAGTLDPLATGLLILCTGKCTKQIDNYQAQEKTYTGTILLGKTTPSYDLETEFDTEVDASFITQTDVDSAVKKFMGDIEQLPPMFSALKQKGKKLYELARKGIEVERAPRQVTVKKFDVKLLDNNEIAFEIICSKGTYIRSLAYDLGQELKVGGCLTSLVRTAIGDFKLSDAWILTDFVDRHGIKREQKI